MNKPRYIAHYGKEQPVGDDVKVEAVARIGSLYVEYADRLRWFHCSLAGDIIAYRVLDDE